MGYAKPIPLTNYDIWFLRLNSDGDTLWTKTYGGVGDDYGHSMKKTDDGGFILAGITNSFGAGDFDFYIIRIDSIGDTLWTKTIGGVNKDFAHSVDKTPDGGFVVVGETNAFPPNIPDGMIIKLDSLGTIIWQKIYGNNNLFDRFNSVRTTSDGFIFVAGMMHISGVNEDGWLLKLNSTGDSLWSKHYGEPIIEEFFSNSLTSDMGHICSGSTLLSLGGLPDLFLVKTDSLGNEQWSKTLDYDNDGDAGYSVQQTSDGGYIISGEARPFDGVAEAWIVRTDSIGNVLWDKLLPFDTGTIFDNPSDGTHGGNSVKQPSDGGYIIAGYSDKFQGNHLDVYLVRIASDIVPVELTSFTATVQQNTVTLNWQTATETNNSGFEIERTSPLPSPYEGEGGEAGSGWNVIGFVPGFGTTTELKSYSFVDGNVSAGNYQYRLKQIDFDGSFEYSNTVEVEITSPTEFFLEQNYPNPFNPSTNIQYSISSRQFVSLKIFNSLGEEIETLVNEFQEAGVHSKLYIINSALPSGVYYYQLRAGGFVETKKMLLMK